MRSLLLAVLLLLAAGSSAQKSLTYTLRPDTARRSFEVTLRLDAAPSRFTLAMATHVEYDDRYWRYLEDLRAAGTTITRRDSALWEVHRNGSGPLTIRYRIALPPDDPFRAAWKPFLSSKGGLLGGPHSFVYIPGKEDLPVTLALELPAGWKAYGALQRLGVLFTAPNVATLLDAPLLAGKALQQRTFSAGAVPHQLVYYSADRVDAGRIDTFARALGAIARGAGKLFGSYPFRSYYFLVQDAAYGGLEHAASVTLGIPAEQLQGPDYGSALGDAAHEYLHAWNLVAMRPKGYGGLTWKRPGSASELWFSEGFTLYYADLLLRRAGLPHTHPSRLSNLEAVLEAYYRYSGNYRIAPRTVSLASNAAPGALGDYNASPHQQGELIATLLDWKIRIGSGGRNNLDTAMRALYRRYGGGTPLTESGLQTAFESACTCRLDSFFQTYIARGGELPVTEALAYFNWGMEKTPVVDSVDNQPRPDRSLYAWNDSGTMRLGVSDPESPWGRAGLHTGDELLRFNGDTVATQRGFFAGLRNLQAGKQATVRIRRSGVVKDVDVLVSPAQHTRVEVFLTGPSGGLAADTFSNWLKGN